MSKRRALLASALAMTIALGACEGEDRPDVDVIGGNGSGSVSVSASSLGPEPSTAGGTGAQTGGQPTAPGKYGVVSNVDTYFAIALDLRDMRALMQPAGGGAVDWAAVTAIYATGKNQVSANGSVRALAAIPDASVTAMFANGNSVYGRPNFIDAMIRDGLAGTGRGAGLPDDARRQIVDKGVQMMMYGKALQELDAAKQRVAARNLDNNTGAPHAVDEAWGTIAGPPDTTGARPFALLGTAAGRETNFGLQGQISGPLEAAFVAALAASQSGDQGAFDRAHNEIKARLNAIFYLATLRYVKQLESATTEAQRQVQFAEGWSFWQSIRATVAGASSSAAQTVEAAYTRPANQPFPSSETTKVYAALNEPAVLQALGIPAILQVKSPPAQ